MRRPSFRLVATAFFLRESREALSYKATFALQLGGLLFAMSALYYLARFIGNSQSAAMAPYGSDYLGFALIGFIMTELQATAIGAFATRIRWAQVAGTLEAMLATPARPWHILIAAPVGDFLEALLRAGAYVLLGVFVFGMRFEMARALPAALAWLLALGAFTGLGFLAAGASMFLRKGEPIRWLVSGLSVLVGGVIYPTAILPEWLRKLGSVLPITHAMEVMRRAMLGGASLSELAGPLWILLGFCVVLLPLGLLAFKTALIRAREDGSLTHY